MQPSNVLGIFALDYFLGPQATRDYSLEINDFERHFLLTNVALSLTAKFYNCTENKNIEGVAKKTGHVPLCTATLKIIFLEFQLIFQKLDTKSFPTHYSTFLWDN